MVRCLPRLAGATSASLSSNFARKATHRSGGNGYRTSAWLRVGFGFGVEFRFRPSVTWSSLSLVLLFRMQFVTAGIKHLRFWTLAGSTLLSKKAVVGTGYKMITMLAVAFGPDDLTASAARNGQIWLWRGRQVCAVATWEGKRLKARSDHRGSKRARARERKTGERVRSGRANEEATRGRERLGKQWLGKGHDNNVEKYRRKQAGEGQ